MHSTKHYEVHDRIIIQAYGTASISTSVTMIKQGKQLPIPRHITGGSLHHCTLTCAENYESNHKIKNAKKVLLVGRQSFW